MSKVWWNSSATGLIDQTSAANNPTPSDVQLGGNVGDTHIVGDVSARFTRIYYNITGGVDVSGAVVWEYWNGFVWKQFPTVKDYTQNFTQLGLHIVDFTAAPTDWALATIPSTPKDLQFTAFYARARTVAAYATATLPTAAQVSLFLVPSFTVDITVILWNGIGVPDANVSLWLPGSPPVLRWTLNASKTAGIYEFSLAQHQLTDGQTFFIRIARVGYQNISTPNLTYYASLPVNDKGIWILHGSLQINVMRGFDPFTGVPSATGIVSDRSTLVASGKGISNGTIEFGVDWRIHPQVNITVFKPGWVTNSSVQNILLSPWNTATRIVSLQTTLRVTAMTELGLPVPQATITIMDSSAPSHIVLSAVDGSGLDEDGLADGIVYLALNPSSVSNPLSITVSRPGFSTWTESLQRVTSLTQLDVISSQSYGLRIIARDELNNTLTLMGSETSFRGLIMSQLDFFRGIAYMAADPSSPGELTISTSGYVTTTTFVKVTPTRAEAFVNQTITYQPVGGTGPGLPFTVKVFGIADQLGNPLITASVTAPGVATILSGGIFYLPLPASTAVNLVASAQGYVNTTATVTPSSSSQTTVEFGTLGFSASTNAPGLQFALEVHVAQLWDGSAVPLATVDAFSDSALANKIASSQSDFYGNAFLAILPSTIYLQASKPGYSSYNSPALQVSSSHQTTATAALTTETRAIDARGATILVTANANITSLSYVASIIIVTFVSPSPGTMNITIPRPLVPAGYLLQATLFPGNQTINGAHATSFQLTQDETNVYLQIPTPARTNTLQITLVLPSLLQSLQPLVIATLPPAVFVTLVVFLYKLTRHRRRRKEQVSPPWVSPPTRLARASGEIIFQNLLSPVRGP